MNYRHIYHAGNFADVFKHWILTLLLQKLCEKPTPFCVIDTHAGLGWYNLHSIEAQKTLEYLTGIELLLKHDVAADFSDYVKIVIAHKALHVYPGSPAFIQEYLRAKDRLFVSELHPHDFQELEAHFATDKRIKFFNQDGLALLKAVLPPAEKRGLVFIDPPFEQTDEFAQIVNSIQAALKRFAHGMYAIWYPIKDPNAVHKFYQAIQKLGVDKICFVELHANQPITNQLPACGMLFINPPWKLDETLQQNIPLLIKYLGFAHGSYQFGWLT